MLFENAGCGNTLFNLRNGSGNPDVIAVLHTRLLTEPDIRALAEALAHSIQGIWPKRKAPVSLVMKVHPDQSHDSLYLIITNLDASSVTHLHNKSLEGYRAVLRMHRSPAPNPPLSHELCVLPSGDSMLYQGVD